jgi:hypothetical protein
MRAYFGELPIMKCKPAIALTISFVTLLGQNGRSYVQSSDRSVGQPAPAAVTTLGSDWTMTVEETASVIIKHKGAPIVRMSYLFWGAKFVWAGIRMRFEPQPRGGYRIVGDSPGLKLNVSGTVDSTAPNSVVMDYQFDASQTISEAIGGCVQWALSLDSPSFTGRLPDPVLREDKTGWDWPVAGDRSIRVQADNPLPDVYFEKGQKSAIRTFFYAGRVPAGRRRARLTITLPEGGRREPSATERYGEPDTHNWYRNALTWDAAPVDLRFLNRADRPAGRHGFVKADGDRLVFEDGTPAKFWGGNLAAYALFRTPKQNVAPQAKRMAQLGYNLMRFIHHDADWVRPNIFDAAAKDTRHLNPAAFDALDWWIKCLKDEGIYVWLTINSGRKLRPGDPVSFGRDEIHRRNDAVQGFHYFNDELRKLIIEFQHNYLSHVNPYTRLAYKDDPAVMGVMLTNEDNLTFHFGNLFLPDKNTPEHNALFTREYKAFARRYGLPEARVFQTWLPGPSKLFLNEFEHQFNVAMMSDLRALGARALVATTSFFGDIALFSLPALSTGDVIDVHSYGNSEAMSTVPRHEANYLSWITAAHVDSKPLTVSEWNVPYPAPDRFTSPLYMASISALQGWDALMLFNYSQSPLVAPQREETWSTFFDPGLSGVMPAAALAFRQGHVSPARNNFCLALGPAQFFDRSINPTTSATIRTLTEQSKLTIAIPAVKELPWLEPSQPRGATMITDPDHDFIPAGQSFVRSDTGELTRDWEHGIQTIDTERTQAVSGWIGGKLLKTRDASFQFRTGKAVIALSSVDGRPVASSRFILITAMARVVSSPGGRLPLLSEPVIGTISLRTTVDGLDLLALGRDGQVVGRAPPSRSDGALSVSIPAARGTHWFVLKTSQPAGDSATTKDPKSE